MRTQSTYLFGAVCPERGAGADRNQNRSGRSRYSPPRSSRLAWRQGPQGSKQHLALAAPATRTRTQRPRKYLAIHAAELVVEPNFPILRRYRRSLLLRLEHAHRSAVENHVHRPPRLGSRRSLNLRIGISPFAEGEPHDVGTVSIVSRYCPNISSPQRVPFLSSGSHLWNWVPIEDGRGNDSTLPPFPQRGVPGLRNQFGKPKKSSRKIQQNLSVFVFF